jgi:hypothetical protein
VGNEKYYAPDLSDSIICEFCLPTFVWYRGIGIGIYIYSIVGIGKV